MSYQVWTHSHHGFSLYPADLETRTRTRWLQLSERCTVNNLVAHSEIKLKQNTETAWNSFRLVSASLAYLFACWKYARDWNKCQTVSCCLSVSCFSFISECATGLSGYTVCFRICSLYDVRRWNVSYVSSVSDGFILADLVWHNPAAAAAAAGWTALLCSVISNTHCTV